MFLNPRNRLAKGRMETLLERHASALAPGQRYVVESCWGIERPRKSLGEIGAEFRLTPEAVRRALRIAEQALMAAEEEAVRDARFPGRVRNRLKPHEEALKPLLASVVNP